MIHFQDATSTDGAVMGALKKNKKNKKIHFQDATLTDGTVMGALKIIIIIYNEKN